MNESAVEIGNVRLDLSDIKKYWVDCESADERRRRLHYQENNYLGGVFSLLVAGVLTSWLTWKNRKSTAKKYLHIKTAKNDYCFSEDEVNIDDVLGKLNNQGNGAFSMRMRSGQ